jgi:hypothetical protein
VAEVHGAVDVVITLSIYRREYAVLCWVAGVNRTGNTVVTVVIDHVKLTPFSWMTPIKGTADAVITGPI